MNSNNNNRHLKLILGQQTVTRLTQLRVLLVGAGGIGCEVAKNVVSVGVRRLTVVDFDHIEETNLNRQFYFRRCHVGLPKATVLKQELELRVSEMEVTAICDTIYSKQFTHRFYDKFDMVISALDSIKAREHLAAMATRNNKPFIDAGTMSYHGQAYASIRFLTTCHNCEPSRVDLQTTAACLIRSRPERPIHCGTYAKNIYQSFFGKTGETMSERLRPERFMPEGLTVEDEDEMRSIAERVFGQLFDEGIMGTDQEGNQVSTMRKLKLGEALDSSAVVTNPESTKNGQDRTIEQSSLYEEQNLWSLQKYAQRFLSSMISLLKRGQNKTIPCNFQKDDDDCMLLVYCITTLRTFNFINYSSPDNKLKFLTYYQCKDLIGKVMPAIASANAIAAALQVRQLVNIVGERRDRLRVIHFTNRGEERLSPCFQSAPLLNCHVCSEKVIYAKIELDMGRVLFREFQDFAKKELFSFGRDVYSGSFALIRNGRKTESPNKDKPIDFVEEMVCDGILPISFRAGVKGTPITVHISIYHLEGVEGIRVVDGPSKRQLKLQLLRYFRKVHENATLMRASQLKFYGGFDI